MSSLVDLSQTDVTAAVEPLSLGKLYRSDPVFDLSSDPSAHSQSHTRASDQDAFSYRKIGPAIVLKSYQPKNSSLDSASSASSNLEDSAHSEDLEKCSLRAPFTYTADSIYEELSLTEPPNCYNLVDGEQMTLLQFDQDSLDTQVEQSYKTAVTNTSCPTLAHADDFFQSCELEGTESTNQTQLIDQVDLLSGDAVPLPASSHPQPHKLILPLLFENPLENSEPLLPDCVMEPSAPKEILDSEPTPDPCLTNLPTAPPEDASTPPPLAEVPSSLPSLDDGETTAENLVKIAVPMESRGDDKHAASNAKSPNPLNEGGGDSNSGLPHVENSKPLPTNPSETCRDDSIQMIGTCPITPQSEVASKSDDQETVETTAIQSSPSTVIQSSLPIPTAKTPASRLAPEKGANKLTSDKSDSPSKPTLAVKDMNKGAEAPSLESIPQKTPVSDAPPVTAADKNPISISCSPVITREGDLTTFSGIDVESKNATTLAGKPTDPSVASEPTSIAQVTLPPVVQCETFLAISGIEDNVTTAPVKQRASINTLSEGVTPTSRENDSPESGKDAKLAIDEEPSNDRADKAQMSTSMSSKQASRMRSISGFFKTLNKKQNVKADMLNSPGSASIESSEEDKSSQGIKELPKRKSLSSLKVKARFSSFYRSIDEPVPAIPKAAQEPPRISEEKREVAAVEGKPTPLRKCETRSPPSPKNQQQLQPPRRAARATSQVISVAEVKASKINQQYNISRAKRGLRSRSQTIMPSNTSPIQKIDKPFASVIGDLGSATFPRPKTLRKKRTFNTQVSTPVLKDLPLSGLISKLMRKNAQKAEEV